MTKSQTSQNIVPQPEPSVARDIPAEPAHLESEQRAGSSFRNLLRAPKFGDPARDRIAGLQQNILIALFLTSLLGIGISLAFWSGSSINGFGILVFEIFLSALAFFWQRRGYLERTSWILVSAMYLVFILALSIAGFTFPVALIVALTISLAGLLLPYYSVIAVTVFTIVTLWVLPSIIAVPVEIKLNELGYASVIFVLEGLLLTVASRTLERAFAEANRSTRDLLHANRDLQGLTTNLEQRVAQRTHDLDLASEIGRTTTEKVSNLQDMLVEAVEMIRAKFELYYTQVYLMDAAGRSLALRAGTGPAGRELVHRGHQLPIGPGSINGTAAAEKRVIIVADTTGSDTFHPNPLLPDTHSEMAVPLIVRDRVVGVLDLQSAQPGALTSDNLPAFEALASQLAIAIENAALFAETEQARAEVEAQVQRLTRSGWREFLDAVKRSERLGYTFDQQTLVPLTEPLPATADPAVLDAPILLLGEPIGRIQLERDVAAAKSWESTDWELVNSIANRVAAQVENLRLQAQAEQYRAEAEAVMRRLTREGWDAVRIRSDLATGYVYDLSEVKPLPEKSAEDAAEIIRQPFAVRDETIGELAVEVEANSTETAEIIAAVAKQLSGHLETLRLSELNERRAQREQALRQITSALRSSTDPATIMRIAVRELGSVLGRKTVIQMTDPEQVDPAESVQSRENKTLSPAGQS